MPSICQRREDTCAAAGTKLAAINRASSVIKVLHSAGHLFDVVVTCASAQLGGHNTSGSGNKLQCITGGCVYAFEVLVDNQIHSYPRHNHASHFCSTARQYFWLMYHIYMQCTQPRHPSGWRGGRHRAVELLPKPGGIPHTRCKMGLGWQPYAGSCRSNGVMLQPRGAQRGRSTSMGRGVIPAMCILS